MNRLIRGSCCSVQCGAAGKHFSAPDLLQGARVQNSHTEEQEKLANVEREMTSLSLSAAEICTLAEVLTLEDSRLPLESI